MVARGAEGLAPDITYSVVRTRFLGPGLREKIGLLVINSAEVDFGKDRGQYFAARAEHSRTNLNRGVNEPGYSDKPFLAGQRFANQRAVLAHMGGQLVGYMPTADNASSNRSGIAASLERAVKLHASKVERDGRPAIGSRFRWFGYVALSDRLRDRENAAADRNRLSPLDIMAELALKNADSRQPISAYPYQEEGVWKRRLGLLGVTPFKENGLPVTRPIADAFGDIPGSGATQEVWRGSVGLAQTAIETRARALLG